LNQRNLRRALRAIAEKSPTANVKLILPLQFHGASSSLHYSSGPLVAVEVRNSLVRQGVFT
jgi:hypothetical protein